MRESQFSFKNAVSKWSCCLGCSQCFSQPIFYTHYSPKHCCNLRHSLPAKANGSIKGECASSFFCRTVSPWSSIVSSCYARTGASRISLSLNLHNSPEWTHFFVEHEKVHKDKSRVELQNIFGKEAQRVLKAWDRRRTNRGFTRKKHKNLVQNCACTFEFQISLFSNVQKDQNSNYALIHPISPNLKADDYLQDVHVDMKRPKFKLSLHSLPISPI